MPTVNASSKFVKAPIEILKNQFLGSTPEYEFYTIIIDALVYPGSAEVNNQFIVDSGTTLNYLPNADAAAFNALFDPPAVNNPDFGVCTVALHATPPELGVQISGEVFCHNPLDLI